MAGVHELDVAVSVCYRLLCDIGVVAEIVGCKRGAVLVRTRELTSDWEESGQLDPGGAKLLLLSQGHVGRVVGGYVGTQIGSGHGYAKHVHIHHSSNRVPHILPSSMTKVSKRWLLMLFKMLTSQGEKKTRASSHSLLLRRTDNPRKTRAGAGFQEPAEKQTTSLILGTINRNK